MKVAKDRVISIDYTIRLATGEVVETSVGSEPLTYLQGRRQIVPGVEQAVEGHESGASLEVVVPPPLAYGDRDPSGVFVIPRSGFPDGEEVGPGMMFSARRPDGRTLTFRVVEANEELVLVDTNHPLAGETLHVSVEVRQVRAATEEELGDGEVRITVEAQPELLS